MSADVDAARAALQPWVDGNYDAMRAMQVFEAAIRAEAGTLDDSDRAAEAALLAGWFHRGEEVCEHDMEPWSCVISAELLVKDFDVRAREGVHHSLPRGWYKAMWGAEASRGLDDSLVRHLTQWLMQSGYQRDYEHARAEAEGFDNWHLARRAGAER